MGVSGYGVHITGLYQSSIYEIDTEGNVNESVSDSRVFPAPGVTFPMKVHTNTNGLRVLIRRDVEDLVTEILIWGADRGSVDDVYDELSCLMYKIRYNNEVLSREFESWSERAVF